MADSAAELIAQWRAAALSGDTDRLCSLYADDAVVVDLCGEVHHGHAAHRCAGRYRAQNGPSADERADARWVQAGDVAVAAAMWQVDGSSGLTVLQRQPDGTWRVLIDLLGDVS
jgi:ketosteroid isomerase-like protein